MPRRDQLIPELQDLPQDQRQRVWRRSTFKAVKTWQFWGLCLLYGCVMAVAVEGARRMPFYPDHEAGRLLVTFGATAAALAIVLPLHFGLVRRVLWRELPHLCDQCGYNMTGNTSGRCPECGHERQSGR